MEKNDIRVTDSHIFFWSGWPSNWYPAKFKVIKDAKEIEFQNSEQYFMYMKAVYFEDFDTASEIVKNGGNPNEAKRLGRLVKNFDPAKWDNIKESVMFDANFLKYMRNRKLYKKLTDPSLDGKHFVEGSPYDKIWGIGVHYMDASDDESTWKGQNLLGKTLDTLRNYLIERYEN